MSDLQCAARLLLISTDEAAASDWLRSERIAFVYDGQHDLPSQQATAMATALGVGVRPLGSLIDGQHVIARDTASLDLLREIADLHRGETVVVLGAVEDPFMVRVDGDGLLIEHGLR